MNQRNVRLFWIVLTVIFYIPGIVAIVNQNATDAAKWIGLGTVFLIVSFIQKVPAKSPTSQRDR